MKISLKRKPNGKVMLDEKQVEDLRRLLKGMDRVEIEITTKEIVVNLDPRIVPKKQHEE